MPFNRNTGSLAGKKSKRGNGVINKELKIKLGEIFNETLDSINVEELTTTEKIKLIQVTINYIMAKENTNESNNINDVKSIVFMPA